MNRLTEIARLLHAEAAAGLLYSKNVFDREHYTKIQEIAAELLNMSCEDMPADKALELFEANGGYQTPKIDTRAVIFNDQDEILLVHDYDGKWALPGGWCDFDQTIYGNTIKEAREEAGLEVEPYRLVAAHSHQGHNNPNSFFHVIRFFILCKVVGGCFTANSETSESKYFSMDNLPEDLNTHKSNPDQLRICLKALHDEHWLPEID